MALDNTHMDIVMEKDRWDAVLIFFKAEYQVVIHSI